LRLPNYSKANLKPLSACGSLAWFHCNPIAVAYRTHICLFSSLVEVPHITPKFRTLLHVAPFFNMNPYVSKLALASAFFMKANKTLMGQM